MADTPAQTKQRRFFIGRHARKTDRKTDRKKENLFNTDGF